MAFLSLAQDAITTGSQRPAGTTNSQGSQRFTVVSQGSQWFGIGMLLGFFAIATHLMIIIVAGRASALSFRFAAKPPKPESRLAEFRTYFEVCEQLQLLATTIFLTAVLFVTYLMYEPLWYPFLLIGYTFIGGILIYRTGFWRASVLVEDCRIVWRAMRNLGAPQGDSGTQGGMGQGTELPQFNQVPTPAHSRA